MSDIFSEVEEEFRNERLKTAWKRFGFIPIGLAVLIVLATAGFKGAEYWQAMTAARDGDRFLKAIALASEGDHGTAEEALLALAGETSSGYGVIARFRAATEAGNAGDVAGSIETFRALAVDPTVPDAYQDLAEIRAAYLAVDTESYEDLVDRIGHFAQEQAAGGWSAFAHEVLGLAAYKGGDLRTARTHFDDVMASPAAAASTRERAEMMAQLITGRIGAAGLEAETSLEAVNMTEDAVTASSPADSPDIPDTPGANSAEPIQRDREGALE